MAELPGIETIQVLSLSNPQQGPWDVLPLLLAQDTWEPGASLGSSRICIPGCISRGERLSQFPLPNFLELPPSHPLRMWQIQIKLRLNCFPLVQKEPKSHLPSLGAATPPAWSFDPRDLGCFLILNSQTSSEFPHPAHGRFSLKRLRGFEDRREPPVLISNFPLCSELFPAPPASPPLRPLPG